MTGLITVVTIGFNSLDGLRDTRASVRGQTYAPLQHLLVDGASTDGSAEQVQQWAVESADTHAVSEPDDGIYDAMNHALDRIDGGFVIFLHAGDTFVDDDVLARAMTAIESAAQPPDLAIGWSRFVNSAGPMPFVVGGATPNAVTSAHESTIFSMEFHRHERYDTDLQLGADYAFFRDLAARADLHVLRLGFTISHFVFGGRSNDPAYDGARFLERARIDGAFGEQPTAGTYARIGARMATRKLAYRVLGADRAATLFLRLACRRGNSGARALPVTQVDVPNERSPG